MQMPVDMTMPRIVRVVVGSRWNHPEMLYYNITGVHGGPNFNTNFNRRVLA
jgi:hypothetical protein